MSYQVEVAPAALRELRRLRGEILERIQTAMMELADNPRPHGCTKLSGFEVWRVRVGDYRILYEIEDDRLIVTVIRVRHRSDAYR